MKERPWLRTSPGPTRLELRSVDGNTLIGSVALDSCAGEQFAIDARRAALIGSDELLVMDTESGEVRTRLELAAPPLGKFDGACAFHGASQVVLGWGNDHVAEETGTGVDVYDLTTGARVGRHRSRSIDIDTWGARVAAIESMPELGRVAYSVSAGLTFLLDDTSWAQIRDLDFSRGNPSPLRLSRARGSERMCISGMSLEQARIVDAKTFEFRAEREVSHLVDLRSTEPGSFFHI